MASLSTVSKARSHPAAPLLLQNPLLFSLISPRRLSLPFFFFNDTATTEIYTPSLHDALPISFLRSVAQIVTAYVAVLRFGVDDGPIGGVLTRVESVAAGNGFYPRQDPSDWAVV